MVVFPQFCPVAAMNILFAKGSLLMCSDMALTLCHKHTCSDRKCKSLVVDQAGDFSWLQLPCGRCWG